MSRQFTFGYNETVRFTVSVTAESEKEAIEKFDEGEFDDLPSLVDSGYPTRSIYNINGIPLVKEIPDYYDRNKEE